MARLLNALQKRSSARNETIMLNEENLNDIRWWLEHIRIHNGVPMVAPMIARKWEPPGSIWSSDSSKTGLGGWSVKSGQFFHHRLSEQWQELDINSLECLALMLCFHKWSEQCAGKRVLVNCDNQTTVCVINSGAAKNKFLQACLREIHHICALIHTEVQIVWVKTAENAIADNLSRWDQHPRYQQKFRELTKDFNTTETLISPEDLCFKHTTF